MANVFRDQVEAKLVELAVLEPDIAETLTNFDNHGSGEYARGYTSGWNEALRAIALYARSNER